MTISILGAGSWGSALAIAISHVHPVILWSNDEGQVAYLQEHRTNPNYLPETIKFSHQVIITHDLSYALSAPDLIIIATPLFALRSVLEQLKLAFNAGETPDLIWVCKGFELETEMLPHQIIQEIFPQKRNYGAMLGPTFAKEVALAKPTAIALASLDANFAQYWVNQLYGIPNFRIYANNDLIGAEIGAAVKNIIAIASGIADGLELGFNARAALITRSLNEIAGLIKKLGGKIETVYGLTGIGDLILTCTGDLSRNRMVGLELASGAKISAILDKLGHVAEGVPATKAVYMLAQKLHLQMPIVETVYKIIYEDFAVKDGVVDLLKRAPKFE